MTTQNRQRPLSLQRADVSVVVIVDREEATLSGGDETR